MRFLLVSAFMCTILISGGVYSQENEALVGVERYLEITAGQLLDEGYNSRTHFHKRAIDGLGFTKHLMEKYNPDQYSLARQCSKKGELANNPEYQTILNEVGFHGPLVELPARAGVKHIINLFLAADQDSSCKESIEELKKGVLAMREKANLDKVNLLISILNEKC